MKQLFLWWISSVMLLLFITSCDKEPVFPNESGLYPVPLTLRLVADNWAKDRDGNFINTFTGVFLSDQYAKKIEVYVVDDTDELLISNGIISYMEGLLWSTRLDEDLNVLYQPINSDDEKPFDMLNIKVVIH